MNNLRSHYRIMHRAHPDREPSCALVEVIYNDDGSIACTMEPVFVGVSPDEVIYDLGVALRNATESPTIQPKDVVGHQFQDVPF